MGTGIKNEVQRALDEGVIKHISFSFHGDVKDLPYTIETFEMFSSVLLQYNLLDRANEVNIDYLSEKGLGVAIMGPVAGGGFPYFQSCRKSCLVKIFLPPSLPSVMYWGIKMSHVPLPVW